MAINETLTDRKNTHGAFYDNAFVAQKLKRFLHSQENWRDLSNVQKEGLEMICHKLARIMSGNPNEPDHWHDIAGYATLVERDVTPGV